jgi:hypothetical protein
MHLAHFASFSAEIAEVMRAIVGVIDMSNPEHETFADSAADCLDELLRHDERIRASLAAVIAAQAEAQIGDPGLRIEPVHMDDRTPSAGTSIQSKILNLQAHDEDARPLLIAKLAAANGLDFWNKDSGFGRLADATVFTPAEAAEFDLPIVNDEPEWITMPLIS